MTGRKRGDRRSTRAFCDHVATRVIDHFSDYLMRRARDDGLRHLAAQDIAHLARTYKKAEKETFLPLIQRSAEAWLGEVEKDLWEQTRKRPFERALVKRFSYLFPPTESLESPAAVSRRILPALFLALEKLAGAEFIEQCQGAGRRIFHTVREERGPRFEWRDFYEDLATMDLVDDLMVVVAWGFKDVDGRLDWLLRLLNGHLAPPEDYAFEGETVRAWTLKKRGLVEIMRALFSEFEDKLEGDASRRRMALRYGERACRTLEDVLGELGTVH